MSRRHRTYCGDVPDSHGLRCIDRHGRLGAAPGPNTGRIGDETLNEIVRDAA
jgi:hypothetical protein